MSNVREHSLNSIFQSLTMPSSRMPRPTRVEVNFPAVLVMSDGSTADVLVQDLSRDGFRIQIAQQILVGERVRLRAGKYGDLAAEIRWVRDVEAGGEFL
jgi:hypothetical protein